MNVFVSEVRQLIDRHLPHYVQSLQAEPRLKEAMCYSLEAGGKRVRPLLLMAVLEAYGKPISIGLEAACAIEMVHTYSLIHDDLPAMDDDDYRRGQLTNHKMYDEATAILAGDALLTHSFGLIADAETTEMTAEIKVALISIFSKAIGAPGMVGGQLADMLAEKKSLTVDELAHIHRRKTGDLLTFSIVAGAYIAGVNKEDRLCLEQFGQELGLVFQIKDDILDVESDSETLGKPVGSDETNYKSTYPGLLGLDGAKKMLSYHHEQAKGYLHKLGLSDTILGEIADYLVERLH
ncbi:polyprenyl synthetase family protein [Shouchella lonarensis]|uniref:Farnesyl diphosphate synthase n=1 Tax=Shouchella lonarensis TaxID=1464122 RepID=A0A1G6IEX1_9BACI|nr:farnesyl diphosphate synthase [Shouchella lonarensis]SDC04933.1 farnesyl-diphosphate synthase [Shouchella lonarensis]